MVIESGGHFSIDSVQPPLHFRRKAMVEAALKQWNAVRLVAAMTELADAVLASRKMPALLSLATKARRRAA